MFTSKARSPYRKEVPEGPIHDFWTVVETTAAEEWQARTAALTNLVAAIPTGTEYHNGTSWYNSPAILRHLASPLSELLRDPRSTVVKRTCESTTELFAKCQIEARYLLKDIMPTILSVHAQTVHVIRSYVETMVIEAMNVVPCKMAMPLWLERLKSDKSRTVREACALYLGVGLNEWCDGGRNTNVPDGYLTAEIWNQVGVALIKALRDVAPAVRQHARRGLETIHLQKPELFQNLIDDPNLLRDPRVKKLLAKINSGVTMTSGDDLSVGSSRYGGGSVVSRGSTSNHFRSSGSVRSSNRAAYSTSSNYGRSSRNNTRRDSSNGKLGGIPRNIAVGGTTNTSGGATNNGQDAISPTSVSSSLRPSSSSSSRLASTTKSTTTTTMTTTTTRMGGTGLGPPLRIVPVRHGTTTKSATEPPSQQQQQQQASPQQPPSHVITSNDGDGATSPLVVPNETGALMTSGSFDSATDPVAELPVIASVEELREQAKQKRNSRRSSLLQQRMARSSSNVGSTTGSSNGNHNNNNINNNNGDSSVPPNGQTPQFSENILEKLLLDDKDDVPEEEAAAATTSTTNMVDANGVDNNNTTLSDAMMASTDILSIAHELLEAHKGHVDKIMEILKIEMDVLKDFEQVVIMETTKRNTLSTPLPPPRPTEEEVLSYFESVAVCLDQRTMAGNLLRRSMDRISKG